MDASPAPAPRRIAELDALRGLSALAVGLYHLTFFLPAMIPGAAIPAVSIWWGCYGVQVFFAISGFVILGTLERTRDVTRFAWARVRRLFPEYWLAMAVTAAVAALAGPPRLRVDLVTWLYNLPMLQFWTRTPMVDGVYWSLNVELAFYAGMAAAWRLGWTRRVETVVLGWLVIKWLLAMLDVRSWTTLLLLTQQAPYFAIGLVTYRVWTGERRWTEQVPVLFATFATVMLLDPIHAHWLFAGIAPLFLLLARGHLRWLDRPVLVWMGWISYPFYLLHAVIGYTTMWRLEALGVTPALAALAALAVAGLLATATATLFDRARAAGRAPDRRPSAALACPTA